VSERCLLADGTNKRKRVVVDLQVFYLHSHSEDANEVLGRVRHGADNDHAVQQVDWHAVRGLHVGSANGAHAAIRGEDHDRRQRAFKRAVEIREALDVQHVHLRTSRIRV
jgi:hypothetical protein